MPTTTSTCIEDADENQNGSSFNSSRNYAYLLQHTATSTAKTVGFLFQVPDAISPAAVTGGVLDLVRVANATPGTTITVESNAATLATNLTTRHGAAVTENGSVSWTPASGSNGTVVSSADFGSVLASALTNTTPSGGFRTVAVLVKCNIGSPVGLQAASIEHTTYAEPKLQTTYSAPVNYTANLPAIAPDTTVSALLFDDNVATTGVSALGTSEYAGTYRHIDVYPARSGTKPTPGWPTVMYVHGGGWTEGGSGLSSGENGLHRPLVEKLVDAGYNVVSVSYRLLNVEVFYSYIKLSWPQPLHDVRAGMEWYHTNATNYDADVDKVVIGGHSAGGMIAAFAGLSACRDDSTTYTGRQSPNGDRPAGYGHTDTASPWKFDLDEYGELSSTLKPVGILIWDAPMDNFQMYDSMSGAQRTVNAVARQTLMGVVSGGSTPTATYDEADVNRYIDGTGGTSYATAMSASDIPPIMFVSSTVADIVTATAGITALETSLDAVGYDTSTGNNTLNTVGGLSKYTTGQNHSNVIRQRSPWTEEMAWLAEVLGGGDVALTGAITADTTTTGALTATRPLTGAATAATIAAGHLVAARALTGATSATTTVVGVPEATRPLAGTITASTTTSGVMLSAGLDELAGIIVADITAAGVVVTTRATTGTVTVSTAVAGIMSAPGQVQVTGTITADTTTTGALVATRAMSGATTVTTAAAGVVTVAGLDALTGTITAGTTIAGPLVATRSTSGAASVTTTAAGLVSVAGQDALTGTITVDTMAMGVLAATRVTAGVVIVDVTATGLLVATRAIAGGVTATTTATGAMTVAGQDALSGTITADVTAAGLLTAIRAISGVVTVTTDATGDMTAPGDAPMIGAVIVAVIVAGAMTASAPPTRAWQMTGRRPDVTRTDRRGVTAL